MDGDVIYHSRSLLYQLHDDDDDDDDDVSIPHRYLE
jgi:hypothetical protein